MQQYFVDLLIRIDSVCISTLGADQRKVELRTESYKNLLAVL